MYCWYEVGYDLHGIARSLMLKEAMKLQQDQMWKKGEYYIRIVKWARLSIEYKAMKDPSTGEGVRHTVTKKEFCRLLKGAELLTSEPDLHVE